MTFKNADGETAPGESVESARFFPPSSLRPSASALPNPAPATKRECGGGVGKMEGGKKKKEVVGSSLEDAIEREKEQEGKRGTREFFNRQRRRKLKDLDINILGLLETWGALGLPPTARMLIREVAS